MKNLTILFLLLFVSTNFAFAQEDELPANLYRAKIVTTDGDTAEGIIEWNNNSPWAYQDGVKMFDEALLSEKRVKNKDKVQYKAKSIKTLEFDGRKFIGRKIMMPACEYCSDLKALPKMMIVEVLDEGPIDIYKGYSMPPGVASGVSFDEIYESIRNSPNYLVFKEGRKVPMGINDINIDKWINDSDATYKKWMDGGYGNAVRKKGKKMANFIKDSFAAEDTDLMLTVIRDYNAEMGK